MNPVVLRSRLAGSTDLAAFLGQIMGSPAMSPVASSYSFAVHVSQTEDAYEIKSTLPGVPEDDVDVTVRKNVLAVVVRRPVAGNPEAEKQEMKRLFELPDDVLTEGITARLSLGVLTIALPRRKEEEAFRSIPVLAG